METIVKNNVKKMKEDINAFAEKQKFLKNQRKAVHIKGERLMPASEAASLHRCHRHYLRLMYAAYGLARGKSFSQTENHYPEENHPLNEYQYEIAKFMDKYKIMNES